MMQIKDFVVKTTEKKQKNDIGEMRTTAKQPQRHAKQKHTTIKKDTCSQVDAK